MSRQIKVWAPIFDGREMQTMWNILRSLLESNQKVYKWAKLFKKVEIAFKMMANPLGRGFQWMHLSTHQFSLFQLIGAGCKSICLLEKEELLVWPSFVFLWVLVIIFCNTEPTVSCLWSINKMIENMIHATRSKNKKNLDIGPCVKLIN